MKKEVVLVLDFGGQSNQLIARRIREFSVYSEMVPYDTPFEDIVAKNPRALILSGEPANIHNTEAPTCDSRIYSLGIPVLGIGYGMHVMARELGGTVEKWQGPYEYGTSFLSAMDRNNPLLAGLPEKMQVWMSHEGGIIQLPPGFNSIASTSSSSVAGMSNVKRNLYGLKFHPEAKGTWQGISIIQNFLFNIARLTGDWSLDDFIAEAIEDIRQKVGDKKILCALSGGVDSSVSATLVHRAVSDQLVCVFVDHGLMRKGEPEQVIETFKNRFHMNLIAVDAKDRFLNKLAGVQDPERKRKIIGEEFIRVFEEEKAKLGEIDYLVQGTIYPDIIESGTQTAQTIKSHHNVGGLPEDMDFKLIEPLRLLFKDEVRVIGEKLGIPSEIVWRQPFPGPGLGVRVLEEVTREKLDLLKEADAIVREEIEKAGLEKDIWQAFAVLPPIRSVGVMGDARTYAYPIIIRAVISDDAMTAEWAQLPYELLDTMARRIVNEVKGINRVAYDITSKPPGTIEWE
ncbi:MAG: glutamine-hydrolyzing GMP synthase [Syntrophomonadaceae bacterium]|jgi:GMP synthase (glutamine-hydrolysing)